MANSNLISPNGPTGYVTMDQINSSGAYNNPLTTAQGGSYSRDNLDLDSYYKFTKLLYGEDIDVQRAMG